MICHAFRKESFEDHLEDLFLGNRTAIRLKPLRNEAIYTCGDMDPTIYYVESGSIKIWTQSAAGRGCLLKILTPGELFGELALLRVERFETATAREKGTVWRLRAEAFVEGLRTRGLFEPFIRRLVLTLAAQSQRITHLATEPSRHRLAESLLLVGREIGVKRENSRVLETRISHEELAEMAGMTRPRVSTFLGDFRRLDLIGVTAGRLLVIHEDRLKRYLGEL